MNSRTNRTADAITRTIRAPGSREEKANRSTTTKILRRGARNRTLASTKVTLRAYSIARVSPLSL